MENSKKLFSDNLKKIILSTKEIIDFVERHHAGKQPTKKDMELIPNIQKLVFSSFVDSVGAEKQVLDFLIVCNNDINYVVNNDQTNRGIYFIVYSLVNFVFNTITFYEGEEFSKKQILSLFPVGNSIDEVIQKYKKMRSDFKIND